jgi:hypothetical protein
MRLIIREARKTSDNGWLTYDRIFRQNAAANPSISWAQLDPSLHQSFCSSSSPKACSLCNEVDHRASDCAKRSSNRPSYPQYSQPRRKVCLSWNSGKCMLPDSCEFFHHCATCRGPHKAKDCSQTPPDSLFKRASKKHKSN